MATSTIPKPAVVVNGIGHNGIYRGQYLGSSYTSAQKSMITGGTFDDLYIGDYWTIGGIDYVICHFDYYYRCSDSDVNYHHAIMMPRGNLTGLSFTAINSESPTNGTAQWCAGTTNTTAGGYIGSRMRTVIMPACDTKVKAAFGAANVHAISELYPNSFSSASDGRAKGWDWTTTDLICDLCNETMVYGHQVWGKGETEEGWEVGIDKWQLAIFALNPHFANRRAHWWLRSVRSAAIAANVTNTGTANTGGAANAHGVRPRFILS